MSSPDIITLRDVSFGYEDRHPVLHSLSATISAGSIVSFVGPSGCGKSTLLSIVAGLLTPTSGEVVMQADSSGDRRHGLSMMFQVDTLLPWLTVEQNVSLHYRLTRPSLSHRILAYHRRETRRQAKAEQRAQVLELLELAGLTDSSTRYPYQLSGGMRRRAAFLSAVAPLPRLLLLDEPFSALDEPTRVGIHQAVFEILRHYHITTLLVTHDLAEAISLSDYVFLLASRPAKVLQRYQVPFGEYRSMTELREQIDFLTLYGDIWRQLARQMAIQPSQGSRAPQVST